MIASVLRLQKTAGLWMQIHTWMWLCADTRWLQDEWFKNCICGSELPNFLYALWKKVLCLLYSHVGSLTHTNCPWYWFLPGCKPPKYFSSRMWECSKLAYSMRDHGEELTLWYLQNLGFCLTYKKIKTWDSQLPTYANLPPTPEETTISFGGRSPKLQNSHRFSFLYVKGTGSHKKQEPGGCWKSNRTEKPTPAKPKGRRQSWEKQKHGWPLSLPLAGLCVWKCPGLEGLARFVWEQPSASARRLPPPASSSPGQAHTLRDLHRRDVEMNNGVTGEALVWPQRIFCVLKASLCRVRRRRRLRCGLRRLRAPPGQAHLPRCCCWGTKALVKTKRKLKKMWRMATVESNRGSLKDKSFNYLDFSKGLLTLLVYK